jgi:hypothetical protein
MFITIKVMYLNQPLRSPSQLIKDMYPTTYMDHTYLMIYSFIQQDALNRLLKDTNIKVVVKPPLAVNKVPGHGQAPRNQLIVFEIDDVPEQAKV